MIPRYSHPEVATLWSQEAIYGQWLHIETTVLAHQIEQGVVPREALPLSRNLRGEKPMKIDAQALADISIYEAETKHDVVAFLEWMRLPHGHVGRWIHYGLTSSDLVDTAQGMRFRDMKMIVLDELSKLVSELTRWSMDETPILGRTHGQPAEPMLMRARAWHWMTTLATPATDLSRFTSRMTNCKLSGPVGTYSHTTMELERMVADSLGLRPHGPGSSQIASRAPLAAWANAAAQVVQACAKIAMDIRLMNLLGEAEVPMAEGQQGSSSMAHKRNPIKAEQIGGMARLAQGYALMLQPLDVWMERDISHSSVERVAVPDLWHVTMHSIEKTTEMLKELKLNEYAAANNIRDAGVGPLVADLTLQAIDAGMSWNDAREWALNKRVTAQPEDGIRLMQNYPRF